VLWSLSQPRRAKHQWIGELPEPRDKKWHTKTQVSTPHKLETVMESTVVFRGYIQRPGLQNQYFANQLKYIINFHVNRVRATRHSGRWNNSPSQAARSTLVSWRSTSLFTAHHCVRLGYRCSSPQCQVHMLTLQHCCVVLTRPLDGNSRSKQPG